MKKWISLLLSLLLLLPLVALGESADFSGQTLEIAVTYTGEQAETFSRLAKQFEQEYHCTVNVAEYGDDYENTLKARMASNSLPDVFMTHGWSILRYKEYLMNLADQPWIGDYDESVFGTIRDENNDIYVLMISAGFSGATMVNLDVCEKAGVDPYAIHTWDDFSSACQTIKDSGVTPIGIRSYAGTLANAAGTFITYEGELYQEKEKLLDGTYDWVSFQQTVLATLSKWAEAGFYFEDALTMEEGDMLDRFAKCDSAFIIANSPEKIVTCLTINPDGHFAVLPSFSSQKDGKEFVGIGEGDAFGIWKDTQHAEAAKAFLSYLAKPEIAIQMNKVSGRISCLKSVIAIDDSIGQRLYQEMKTKCVDHDIFYENLWDREYMPSGMWSIFANACGMLFDDFSQAGQSAVREYLMENYRDLYAEAHAK